MKAKWHIEEQKFLGGMVDDRLWDSHTGSRMCVIRVTGGREGVGEQERIENQNERDGS